MLLLEPTRLADQIHLGAAPIRTQLAFAMSTSIGGAYPGIETIANMAKEERDPARDLSRAARSVVVAVISRHLGITVVALSALPVVRTPAGPPPPRWARDIKATRSWASSRL